jgi:hypothetical protein
MNTRTETRTDRVVENEMLDRLQSLSSQMRSSQALMLDRTRRASEQTRRNALAAEMTNLVAELSALVTNN